MQAFSAVYDLIGPVKCSFAWMDKGRLQNRIVGSARCRKRRFSWAICLAASDVSQLYWGTGVGHERHVVCHMSTNLAPVKCPKLGSKPPDSTDPNREETIFSLSVEALTVTCLVYHPTNSRPTMKMTIDCELST